MQRKLGNIYFNGINKGEVMATVTSFGAAGTGRPYHLLKLRKVELFEKKVRKVS